jgi:hypothetical protein
MKNNLILVLLFFSYSITGCITEFIPQTEEQQELLVVEGLITDQPGQNIIKLSRSLPLGERAKAIPVIGAYVAVSDNLGNTTYFLESESGNYIPNSENFKGVEGRFYILHVRAYTGQHFKNYESYPMELKPVPPIDSIYYEKVNIAQEELYSQARDGCQIYLNTHDPSNRCKYFRWEYIETWEFRLPYTVPNHTCWVTDNSERINVKSTATLSDAFIRKYALYFISNTSDRLKVRYSILVNQYSLSEDEYNFWEKVQNLSEEAGGLYDIIPSDIPGNIYCADDPAEKVLGFFSVSASTSKRLFIKDNFMGQLNPYTADACIADTIFNGAFIPNLNISVWVIVDNFLPPYKVITYTRGCADCTTRGTTQEPSFWREGK